MPHRASFVSIFPSLAVPTLVSLALATSLLGTFTARAQAQDLADCGNIYVEANATCTVDPPSIDCNVACEPIRLEAACAGEAYLKCEGGCDANVDVGCSGSCEASCEAQCNVQPGEFDCQAYCQADCAGSCQASCMTSGNASECEASCKGSCTGDCDASCRVRPPKVDCNADCKASCNGSCHAKANVNCQVDCQSKLYVECKARLSGGCKAQCMSDAGALFCEGDYVDTGNKLDSCVQALKSKLDVQVEGYSEGMCANGTCAGQAGGSASCSAAPVAAGHNPWLGLSLFAGLGIVTARRRRRLRENGRPR
jgi:hypothetical protein